MRINTGKIFLKREKENFSVFSFKKTLKTVFIYSIENFCVKFEVYRCNSVIRIDLTERKINKYPQK